MLGFAKKNKIPIEPWNVTFWERTKKITENPGKKRVVYIYEQADSSTFRYRAYNMCQALELSMTWVGSYFFENELSLVEDYLDRIDVVIFVRTQWSLKMSAFLDSVKKRKIPTLFDVDDLVFDVEKIPLIMNTLNVDFENAENYSYWFSYVSRIGLMAKLCDGTISTNEYLSKRLTDLFQKPNFIVNNFLNNEQILISNKLFTEKIRKKNKKKKQFKIGYFSGTPSHINDFKKISAELVRLLERYPEIILEVTGYMEFPEILHDLAKRGRVIHSPFVDYVTLQEKISQADMNLVPLVDNEFTNCKSELKFFEAAVVGTVTCATPTYVFKESIINGKSGYLCEEGDWYSMIKTLYKNGINRDLTLCANEYCLKIYSPEKQVENIEKMLEAVNK